MSVEENIVLMVGLGFLGIVGYKAYAKYTNIETSQKITDLKTAHVAELSQYGDVIQKFKKSNENFKFQINKIRNNYDIDYDDVELEDESDQGTILSDIAKAVYPKLPPSLSDLLDKEEFQNAMVKTVEKRPDILNTFIDKFLNKPDEQGSDSNTTKLTQNYL